MKEASLTITAFYTVKNGKVTIKTSLHNEHLFDVFYDEKKNSLFVFFCTFIFKLCGWIKLEKEENLNFNAICKSSDF